MIDRLKRSYCRSFMLYEFALSLGLVAAAVAFVEFAWGRERLFGFVDGNTKLWYAIVAETAGTLLGFVIAALSILFALTQSERYALLRQSPYYRQVYSIYLSAVMSLGLATVLSLAALLATPEQVGPAWWLLYLVCWAVVASVLRVWRCVWVLWRVIQIEIG